MLIKPVPLSYTAPARSPKRRNYNKTELRAMLAEALANTARM
jgi:hypothetical protein